jgi:hypothetical protein
MIRRRLGRLASELRKWRIQLARWAQRWRGRLTDTTHNDADDGALAVTNSCAREAFLVPPQAVLILIEPAPR